MHSSKESTARKIEQIQELFATGLDKAQVAEKLGYNNIKSFYRYIYANGLVWNPKVLNYEKKNAGDTAVETLNEPEDMPTGREGRIITMLETGIDLKDIATKLKMDIKSIGDFMRAKGYIWNQNKNNYVKQPRQINEPDKKKAEEQCKPSVPPVQAKPAVLEDNNAKSTPIDEEKVRSIVTSSSEIYTGGLDKEHIEFVRMLFNERKQREKNNTDSEVKIIPRYLLQGVKSQKTITVLSSVNELIREFCVDNNINNSEFFEIAAIEFMKNYGYKDEVRAKLKV